MFKNKNLPSLTCMNNRRRRFTVLLPPLLSCCLLAVPEQAAAQDSGESFQRPGYKFLRHAEDWSSYRDATKAQLDDPWDGLKFVPLSDDGSNWATT